MALTLMTYGQQKVVTDEITRQESSNLNNISHDRLSTPPVDSNLHRDFRMMERSSNNKFFLSRLINGITKVLSLAIVNI